MPIVRNIANDLRMKRHGIRVIRFVGLLAAICLLPGCLAGAKVKSYTGPTGEIVSTIRCTQETGTCFEKASQQCNGPYRVTDSYRNAGGLFADVIPGPVTWYTMSIICGKSDGVMPAFPLRGTEPAMPPIPQPAPSSTVNCQSTTVGGIVSTTCTQN